MNRCAPRGNGQGTMARTIARPIFWTYQGVGIGDCSAFLRRQLSKVRPAVTISRLSPNDLVEAQMAVMDITLQRMPFACEFESTGCRHLLPV